MPSARDIKKTISEATRAKEHGDYKKASYLFRCTAFDYKLYGNALGSHLSCDAIIQAILCEILASHFRFQKAQLLKVLDASYDLWWLQIYNKYRDRRPHRRDFEDLVQHKISAYGSIIETLDQVGDYNAAGDLHTRRMELARRYGSFNTRAGYYVVYLFSGYGESISRIFLTFFVAAVSFGAIYHAHDMYLADGKDRPFIIARDLEHSIGCSAHTEGDRAGAPGPSLRCYADYLYLAIIMQTTIGYVNITPGESTIWAEVLAAAEAIVGTLLVAALASVFWKKISRK